MHYNILIGGAAGQGIDTLVTILAKLLKKEGYAVLTTPDFMSRIRGGHNFVLVRFGDCAVESHSLVLDGIVALDDDTVRLHLAELKPDGFILGDESLAAEDPRALKLPLTAEAKALGNLRVVGSIAAGAVLKLFSLSLDGLPVVLAQELKQEYIDVNLAAYRSGYASAAERYPRLSAGFAEHMIVNGSQALALGALAGGLRFYSAYPMSPSTGIMEYLALNSQKFNVVVEQAEDEIAAINMALGASYAGARSMTGTSGGGLALMVEAIGLSGIAEIPLVIVDAQRPGPATGLPTRTEQSDLRFVIHAAQGEFPRKVIAIRNQADAYRQAIRALDIAERYQLPMIILSDQYLADGLATVKALTLPEQQTRTEAPIAAADYQRYRITADGISPRLIPGQSAHLVIADSDEHDENGLITEDGEMRTQMMDKRMRKMAGLSKELEEPDYFGAPQAEVLLLGWGSTWGPIKEAVERLNQEKPNQYGALVFGDIFPLPEQLLREKSKGVRTIINIEQNATGQLAGLVREMTGIVCTGSILKYNGRQLSAEEIIIKIKEAGK